MRFCIRPIVARAYIRTARVQSAINMRASTFLSRFFERSFIYHECLHTRDNMSTYFSLLIAQRIFYTWNFGSGTETYDHKNTKMRIPWYRQCKRMKHSYTRATYKMYNKHILLVCVLFNAWHTSTRAPIWALMCTHTHTHIHSFIHAGTFVLYLYISFRMTRSEKRTACSFTIRIHITLFFVSYERCKYERDGKYLCVEHTQL